MQVGIWTVVIVISILLVWFVGNKIARYGIVTFWLIWTLGLSSLFVGYSLSGQLLVYQIIIILVVFAVSWFIRKQKDKSRSVIQQLQNDLSRLDNPNLNSLAKKFKNNEIKVLDTPKKHRQTFLQTLDDAEKQIIILSGWIMDFSVNKEFRLKLQDCLERGVDIFIGYGYKSPSTVVYKETVNEATKHLKSLQEWAAKKKTKGILEIFHYPNHSKILICDNNYAINGSFNWLSNGGGTENEERSWIIYNKKFIQNETKSIMENLYDPSKPRSRRQILKEFVPFSKH